MREFFEEYGQGLFVRPILRHILALLRRDTPRLFRELEEIFLYSQGRQVFVIPKGLAIRMHIKVAILSDMASWRNPSYAEAQFLLRVFREAPDGEQLEVQFFSRGPDSYWFPHLKEPFLKPALEQLPEDGRRIRSLLYLSQAAVAFPTQVLDIALELTEKPADRELTAFFHWLTANVVKETNKPMLSKKLVELWERVIIRGFVFDSFSIALYCGRIARIDPQRGGRLYFDKLLEQRDVTLAEGSDFLWRNSVGQHFDHVLPVAFQASPLQTLEICRSFLEQFFDSESGAHKRGCLPDYPHMLLYGEYKRHDEEALFEWFRINFLNYCCEDLIASSPLIYALRDSRWRTLQQLSFLGMLEKPIHFTDELFRKAMEILSGTLYWEERYLLLKILETGFATFNEHQREEIVNRLLTYPVEKNPDKERLWVYAPLNHIPDNLRSGQVRRKLDELKGCFGDYKYLPPFRMGEVHVVPSPIPKFKLAQMSPDELYKFLIQNRNLKEKWNSGTLTSIGGVEQLAQEVSNLLAEQLQKYQQALTRLSKDPHNYIYLDNCLSKLEIDETNADWFIDIALNIYQAEEVQLSLARAASKVIPILTPEQWDRLKPVIIYLAEKAPDPDRDTFVESQRQGYSNTAVDDGINTTRGEICEVLLRASSGFWDKDVEVALSTLANDRTVSVRAAFIYYLPLALAAQGWEPCFSLFQKAFKPEEPELMEVAVRFLMYVPDAEFNKVSPLLVEMQKFKQQPILEARAILTALYVIRGLLPVQELDQILFGDECAEGAKIKALDVITGSIASEKHVDKCLSILSSILEHGSDQFVGQIYRVFINARPTDLIKLTPFIGKVITRTPWGEIIYWLLEYLEKATPIYPKEAFEVLEQILASQEKIDYAKGYISPTHSKAPINLVNLVLEIYPNLEERALNVLDKLITMHWTGVDEYLKPAERL